MSEGRALSARETDSRFSEQQQRELCLLIAIGCDRQTACHYVGSSLVELRMHLRRDARLLRRLLRAEAAAELTHIRRVFEAAKEERNWRASVWWLERRAPERYGGRPPAVATAGQLGEFIEQIADAIVAEVADVADRARLLSRIEQVGADLEESLWASTGCVAPRPPAAAAPTAPDINQGV